MMAAFLMYGGMLLTILPTQEGISFEYHLFGAIPGLVSAILFRNMDPKFQRKVYDWEFEEDEDWPASLDEAENLDQQEGVCLIPKETGRYTVDERDDRLSRN